MTDPFGKVFLKLVGKTLKERDVDVACGQKVSQSYPSAVLLFAKVLQILQQIGHHRANLLKTLCLKPLQSLNALLVVCLGTLLRLSHFDSHCMGIHVIHADTILLLRWFLYQYQRFLRNLPVLFGLNVIYFYIS